MLASELYGRRTEDGTIVDVAVSPSKYQRPGDEELADLLEEMPEQDQVRLLASVGLERSADVVEEMQPDDAADLLAELPAEQVRGVVRLRLPLRRRCAQPRRRPAAGPGPVRASPQQVGQFLAAGADTCWG